MRTSYFTGFTLIELIVTIAVGAILLASAVPSFQDFIRSNRLTTQANVFVGAIQLARSEAVKRNASVMVQAQTVGGATNWTNGWVVCVDANPTDGTCDAGGNLRVESALAGSNTLVSTPAATTSITYDRFGGVAAALSFNLCHGSGIPGRQISIALTGRASTTSLPACP